MKKKIFNNGDFVRIKDGTHDEHMPVSRMGHIIGSYNTIEFYKKGKHENPPMRWKVFMTNGKILTFHEMFLEHVEHGPN